MAEAPWVMRTYSGHSTAAASNELYRTNIAKGQTGLSIAFDLPTQIGYDPDDPRARGEVGKVGVPIAHLGHMGQLLDGIPLDRMNTSMTINATAPWLLGLYIANAERNGVDQRSLSGTTQNDIVKEYLSRGTYIYPPGPSRRLIVDTVAYTVRHVPKWNPINVCSYHLQEAGATPTQELAYALATAIGVLDAVRDSGQVTSQDMQDVVGRISFFVNAGIRFVEEMCKMRAFAQMWERICAERYGVTDPKLRRFRYGLQVNSLGLTEAQPENNVPRIVLEMLGVTLSKDARARAVQLPAWNEALGLPRPWDQQWSLRMQQVLAYETDLLDYDDLFTGSKVVETKVMEMVAAAQAELDDVVGMGGAFEAIGELKARLVASHTERTRRIESGELRVVGVNCFTETEVSPLGGSGQILRIDDGVEAEMADDVRAWRAQRNGTEVQRAIDELRRVATSRENVMPATIALARAGGTTGEWAGALREVFGEFRAPTGVGVAAGTGTGTGTGAAAGNGPGKGVTPTLGRSGPTLLAVSVRMKELPGGPIRLLVAKPGLDGHSNGAEQIAVAARDAGMEVVYAGIRLTVEQIAAAARDEDPDVIGISILSGSHLQLTADLLAALARQRVTAPLVVGGIVPEEDRATLLAAGVKAVYTPKDYDFSRIMNEIADIGIARRRS